LFFLLFFIYFYLFFNYFFCFIYKNTRQLPKGWVPPAVVAIISTSRG